MKLQTAWKGRKRGWFLKENQTDLTTPQNPCSCSSLSEAGKCLLQGWCKPHGKALRMAIWTICTAENENWNKIKGNPYLFQESNVFRLKRVCLCYGWSISLPSRGLVHTSSDIAKSLAYNSTEQSLGLETIIIRSSTLTNRLTLRHKRFHFLSYLKTICLFYLFRESQLAECFNKAC